MNSKRNFHRGDGSAIDEELEVPEIPYSPNRDMRLNDNRTNEPISNDEAFSTSNLYDLVKREELYSS